MVQSLTKQQLRDVIDGKGNAGRAPISYRFWINPNAFGDKAGYVDKLLASYPDDVVSRYVSVPEVYTAPADDPTYRWVQKDAPANDEQHGMDDSCAIEDWDELDDILAHFPDPDYPGIFRDGTAPDDRYVLANFWGGYYERLWSLRGMENALTDFYLYPDEIHRFFGALTNFYCRIIERCADELHADGVFTSDDMGTQKGPFFSPEIFRTFFKPYYKRIIETAHAHGMHFWLHSCGNIELFLPDFIEIGLDVIHPIQKYTMDYPEIAEKFGDDICIWAGFDVQQTIPYGTPEDVRKEVRYLLDTYCRENGRLILTLGNVATPDTPIQSLEALLDETLTYSTKKYSRAEPALPLRGGF